MISQAIRSTYRVVTDMVYEIRVKGHLNYHWSDWFCPESENNGETKVTHLPDGQTVIRGTVVDQAALQGVLVKIWDLGLTLNSVVAVSGDAEGES